MGSDEAEETRREVEQELGVCGDTVSTEDTGAEPSVVSIKYQHVYQLRKASVILVSRMITVPKHNGEPRCVVDMQASEQGQRAPDPPHQVPHHVGLSSPSKQGEVSVGYMEQLSFGANQRRGQSQDLLHLSDGPVQIQSGTSRLFNALRKILLSGHPNYVWSLAV